MSIRSILYQNLPRQYGLRWEVDEPAVTLQVHQDLARGERLNVEYMYSHLIKEFGFEEFEPSLDRNFGFDGSLERKDAGEFVEFKAKLPVIRQVGSSICQSCNGTKKDSFLQRECMYCDGTGKHIDIVWGPAYAISASLKLLLLMLEYRDSHISTSSLQLMAVRLHTAYGSQGGSMSGTYSIPVVSWLSMHKGYSITPVVDAMKTSWERMLGAGRDSYQRFRASVDGEGGWLNMDCPGNACGLNPSSLGAGREGRGYEFTSHNVDSPAAQLSLLAGLAALHKCVEEDLLSTA